MKFTKLTSILAVGLLFAATNASAGLIDIVGGSGGSIPGGATNNGLCPVYGTCPNSTATRDGYYGAEVQLTGAVSAAGYRLTFEFLGFEAAFHNEFNLGLSELFDTENVSGNNNWGNLGMFSANITSSGTLAFSFDYDVDGTPGTVSNGSNPDDVNHDQGPNFFVSCDGDGTLANCDSIVLWLDDGGAGPDDNHDDMAIRITARLPEPSSIALLGLGLIGLGVAGFRKRA